MTAADIPLWMDAGGVVAMLLLFLDVLVVIYTPLDLVDAIGRVRQLRAAQLDRETAFRMRGAEVLHG